jgi:hypothetical protein
MADLNRHPMDDSDDPLVILYVDYDGVVQDDDVYEDAKTGKIFIKTPGRTLFEWLHILARIVALFPNVKIVLSTSWVLSKGFAFAKAQLTPELQERVIGATLPEKYAQKKWFKSMSRYEQIVRDVARRKPAAWLAVDNDCDKWPENQMDKLVLTEDHVGLSSLSAQEDLLKKLTVLCSNLR